MKPSDILPNTPGYDLKQHLAYVQQLYDEYPWRDPDACINKGAELILADNPPRAIGEDAAEFFYVLCEQNDLFIFDKPTLEYAPYLARIQRRLTLDPNPAFWEAQRFLRHLYKLVPKGEGPFTVPLCDLADPDYLIALCYNLYDEKRQGEYLFSRTRQILFDNMVRASGHNPDTFDGKGRLVTLADSKLDRHAKLIAYLQGTPFLKLLSTPVPFAIPRKTFASHGIILAPPNHGKTQLAGTLIAGFLNEANPVGCVVLDPHGDLFNTLKTRVPPERLVVLDPDTNPPALNFLDFGTSTQAEMLQTFSYLMSSLSGGLTDKQGAIVPYLLKLLREIPDASLETLRLVVDEKVKSANVSQFAPYIAALPVVDQGFFHNQFYSTPMQVTKDAIGWKLYYAVASDTFREMFSAKTNSFNAAHAMRDRKVVLVKGSETTLGEQGLPIFLQYIVSQFFLAAIKRHSIPPEQRHLYMLFADEASHIFNHQTTRILTECRKWGLGFMGATQLWSQIPDEVKSAILGATAIKIVGKIQHNDASVLSRDMECDVPFIRSLQSVERSHAEWGCHVANLTPRALRITVPFGTLEAMPQYAQSPPQEAPSRNDTRIHEQVSPIVPPATTTRTVNKVEPQATPQNKAEPPDTSTDEWPEDTKH